MLGFGPPNRFPLGENSRASGITGSLTVTLDALSPSSAATVALKAAAAITLDGITLSFTGTVALKAQAAITLADVSVTFTGAVALKAAAAVTLDDVGLTFSGAVSLKAALSVTLDDLGLDLRGGPDLTVTDTEVIQLPVNCVLAGQQPYKQSGREYEIHPMNTTEKTWGRHSRVRALKGGRPSFTVKTGTRGYD